MKYKVIFAVLAIMVFVLGFQQGSSGVSFNKPTQFYSKLNPTASTANDTTGWIPISGASDIAIFGSADDSAAVLISYRLRQNQGIPYAVTTSFTGIDTLGADGAGGSATASGASQRLGAIASSTLLGYSEIQFFNDYLAGTSNGSADGTANTVRFFYHYLKNDAVK